MKLKFFFIFLFLLSLNIEHLTFNISYATVRFVSKSGTSTPPYTSWKTSADSIQKCINICVDGDTVYVANGVYKENLVINTAISLIGSSMDSTVIDGRGMGNVTISVYSIFSINNFNIFGKGAGIGDAAIRNPQTINLISIKNCQISEASIGIGCVNTSIIVDKVLMKNMNRGLSLLSTNPVIYDIFNCIIAVNEESSSGINIGFASEANANIYNNIILFTGTTQVNPDYGISIGAPKKVYINNNLISGFRDNIFVDVIFDSLLIKNNVLINQYFGGATASIVCLNYPAIVNNVIFDNNKRAIYGWPIKSNYNLFWQNETNITGTYGDSDFVANPMFVNDTIPTANSGYDFHLQKYSPAIDKGNLDILDLDGTRSDIGMYGGPFGETYTYQDLAPLAPRNISAVVDTNQILLKWNHNTEADTAYYKVFRDTTINFTIDSTKLVSSSRDTFFVQLSPYYSTKYAYKITCVDKQGNESKPSEEVAVDLTSVSTDGYPITINDYLLYQNYPNPFNPSTRIGYKLKERSYVKLYVYDIKGELVSVLVNKEQNAGYYEAEFSSSSIKNPESSIKGLASGIYLYRIEVIGEGNIPVYTEMKKMLLIK